MSKKDLADAGVHVDGDMQWDRSNLHTVHVESASDELLALLRAEGTFTVSEVDKESGKEVQDVITATKADDTGNTVKDGTTGEVSTKKSTTK
jgi:hypothetical protein